MKRIKVEGRTGVYYRPAKRIGGPGTERVYYVMFKDADGKKIEVKAGRQYRDDMTPAKAERKRAKLIEGLETSPQEKRATEKAAERGETERWTINRLWDQYVDINAGQKGLKNEQIKFDKAIRPDIGKKEPKELLPLDIDRLRLKFQREDKLTMAARVLELLRRTVNFGVKRGLIEPLKFKVEIPRLNNQTTEDLDPAQIEKLVKAMDQAEDQTASNVMRLALATGMRKSEILNLRWEDLDHQRGFITIRDPKGGQDQHIPLNDPAKAVCGSIRNETEFIFPGRFGGPLKTCRGAAAIAKAAGLPAGFRPLHGLRHVFASHLASSGKVDLYVLQRLLTHKSASMTQRYSHLRDDALRDASNIAGELATPKKAKNHG